MEQQKKKSLSEISHLFLSSVRENATGGVRPLRIPPGGERVTPRPGVPPVPRTAMSIDLTPEEYARVVSEGEAAEQRMELQSERAPLGPVSALICSQFNSRQQQRAREYAQHLAANGERVGLIQVDANECSVTCFETTKSDSTTDGEPAAPAQPREMSEALEELAWDIDRWVLLLPNPRTTEARALLKKVQHWVLLSTCDHDGVVSCYRAIKGLAELPRPRLTLALLDVVDKVEAGNVYRKIAGVCEQFLNWRVEAEPAVEVTDSISENLALVFHPSRERAEIAVGPQWGIVGDFLSTGEVETNESHAAESDEQPADPLSHIESPALQSKIEATTEAAKEPVMETPLNQSTPMVEPAATVASESRFQSPPLLHAVVPAAVDDTDCDVSDLPSGEVTCAAILSAVMSKAASGLIECPVRPPSCPQAALAVNRDRRLVLLAATRKGLGELRSIATAYRWVVENRPLLSMAMPQFAIDTHALPALKLLVDRADAGADLLLPMNENGNVTVQTYRKLRWAGKTGLLLEAA